MSHMSMFCTCDERGNDNKNGENKVRVKRERRKYLGKNSIDSLDTSFSRSRLLSLWSQIVVKVIFFHVSHESHMTISKLAFSFSITACRLLSSTRLLLFVSYWLCAILKAHGKVYLIFYAIFCCSTFFLRHGK